MFYTYRQNNTGGSFTKPAINLVIEAEDASEADLIAVEAGAYFDPEYTIDCECCGQRWYRAGDWDKRLTLEDALEEIYESSYATKNIPNCIVIKNRVASC